MLAVLPQADVDTDDRYLFSLFSSVQAMSGVASSILIISLKRNIVSPLLHPPPPPTFPLSLPLFMLKTRLTNAGGSTDNKHSKIWAVAGETKDGGSEVFLMASQVYQSDQLTGILADFFHSATFGIVHHLQKDSHDVSILPVTLYQICPRENCLETVLPKNKQQQTKICVF